MEGQEIKQFSLGEGPKNQSTNNVQKVLFASAEPAFFQGGSRRAWPPQLARSLTPSLGCCAGKQAWACSWKFGASFCRFLGRSQTLGTAFNFFFFFKTPLFSSRLPPNGNSLQNRTEPGGGGRSTLPPVQAPLGG